MWEMFSRRKVFSLLGLPIVGFGATATAPTSLGAEAQTSGAERAPGGGQQHLHAGRTNRQERFAELPSATRRPKLALALQGGGSQGAFTWGVLDRMLEETAIDIVGVTGTSAGAMNGAVLADGLVRGGPKQARAELRRYWEGSWWHAWIWKFLLWNVRGAGCHHASRKLSCLRRGDEEEPVALRSAPV